MSEVRVRCRERERRVSGVRGTAEQRWGEEGVLVRYGAAGRSFRADEVCVTCILGNVGLQLS